MLNIKKALTKLSEKLYSPVRFESWANIATPTASYYNLRTITLPPNGRYLLLWGGGNGLAPSVKNRITAVFNGTTKQVYASTITDGSSGNTATGWGYAETGSSSATVTLQGYGYDTSTTNMNGSVLIVRLPGGG